MASVVGLDRITRRGGRGNTRVVATVGDFSAARKCGGLSARWALVRRAGWIITRACEVTQ